LQGGTTLAVWKDHGGSPAQCDRPLADDARGTFSRTKLDDRKGVNAMLRHYAESPLKIWPSSIAIVAFLAALVYSPLPASAQTIIKGSEPPARVRPLELVKSSFARVLAAEDRQRGIEIRRVGEEFFDFNEMARRMLGDHWQEGSVQEQEEFVRLFTDMLERMYLTNIGSMPLDSVTFDGESVTGSYARVKSRIAGRRGDTSVEYSLIDNAGRWAVYDVIVDGVSLVSSYRSQFNSLLRKSSFTALLERLRSREAGVIW
jgi:phospholipid transport system substrate-binding protein